MSPKFTLESFRKDLSPKYKLVPKLDKAIGEFDEEWTFHYEPKEHDLYWHPSGHCMPVASALYDLAQERLNPDPEQDKENRRKFGKYGPVGHFWHQFLQHIMVRYEMVDPDAIERSAFKGWPHGEYPNWTPGHVPKSVESYVPFHACTGSADVAPWTYKSHDYIVDFKTMGSRNFQAVTPSEMFANKYECQMNIYMDFFDYDRALIVGINKDTPHDFKEYEFRRNQPLIDVIYDKWKFVADCLQHSERPDKDDDGSFVLPLEWV
jgi:hypothetical protein